jgi:hypothetical protein
LPDRATPAETRLRAVIGDAKAGMTGLTEG